MSDKYEDYPEKIYAICGMSKTFLQGKSECLVRHGIWNDSDGNLEVKNGMRTRAYIREDLIDRWFDISSAPRDGTKILVCHANESAHDDGRYEIVSFTTAPNGAKGWYNGDYTYDEDDFTHWRWLTPIPKNENGDRNDRV